MFFAKFPSELQFYFVNQWMNKYAFQRFYSGNLSIPRVKPPQLEHSVASTATSVIDRTAKS